MSNRMIFGLGSAAALLLWLTGFFPVWLIFLVAAVAIIGGLVANLTPTFARPVLIATAVIIAFAISITAIRTSFFTDKHHKYSYAALLSSKFEADLRWAERIDPHAAGVRGHLAIKCRQTEADIEAELSAKMDGISANKFMSRQEVKRVQRQITRLQKFRALCREAVVQTEAPQVVSVQPTPIPGGAPTPAPGAGSGVFASISSWFSGSASSIANSTVVANAKAKVDSTWGAIPFFSSKSGQIVLIGLIFIAMGVVVLRYHKTFGGGIAAAGVVMVLAGMGGLLSSEHSLFAQLRDAVIGDYRYPWYVTVLALTGIGILLMALFGVETRVKFSTIMVAVLLLGLAWFARPDTKLSDVTSKLETKLGGVSLSLPSMPSVPAFTGGRQTVPCSQHDALFRDSGRGELVRCTQRMTAGDQIVVQLYGGDWGINPSDAPIRVVLWLKGQQVYTGWYKANLPVADRIMVLAQAPTSITVNMRKRGSTAKR